MPTRQEIVFGVGIFVGLLGACLLVGFGLRYFKPYLQVRTMEEGICTVSKDLQISDVQKVTCRCSRDSKSPCLSFYPCVQILVNVTASEREIFMTNVTLYDSYETFHLMQSTQLDCSYHKCDRQDAKNMREVQQFINRYGDYEDSYRCFFEPTDPHYAIQGIVTLTTVVHTVLWPSLAVIFGLIVVISYIFCSPPETRRNGYPSSSLERVKNINRDNRYERVCTR